MKSLEVTGAGKYDDLATRVRELSQADGVLVAVLNGNKGTGFSVQAIDPGIVDMMPEILEGMAAEIRRMRDA